MLIKAYIVELKSHFCEHITKMKSVGGIAGCKRNLPIARISSTKPVHKNKTVLGCGVGKINADMNESLIPLADWNCPG
ncbi:hypothetical protein QQ056_17625 [Oscillatoria laete-virens NRMC-F 0139]|nr:hypothetical protein [Oscillatoria laete-virens]MDL5055355.1 hypothetical protein [Oscillatoria laete-virens NRMC-F 0139]